jgi:serine protease Do
MTLEDKRGRAELRTWVTRAGMIVAGCLLLASAASAASLEPRVLPGIEAATFEVVAAKPAKDPLHYAKDLPLDLLPFQERNDKYYSIGTAFAIGGGQYVTAGHVLLVGLNSLWGPPALRDNHGRVYAIDKVNKFSLERDFVVFTLRAQPGDSALALSTTPAAGQAVYSVGNAYGTGVVIRDGLYTSDTPEQQDGRWKWMRFSAAASPGNSGGPLVDQDGKVVGVVLAKSPNENLNYALPIGMVKAAPDGVAEIDQRVTYSFDVFDTVNSDTFKANFALPLPLADFFVQYQKRLDAFSDHELAVLLAKEPERMFPKGEGSSELLNSIGTMGDFPQVIVRDASGQWQLTGKEEDDVKLSGNGYLTPGSFNKNVLFHLRKPDDVTADALYGDPAVPMDLILKTGFIKRPIADQSIVVTSLGKPISISVHVDKWGRRWQQWEWPLPFQNVILAIMALPVPDGNVGIGRYTYAAGQHDQLANLKAMTDLVYANYDGTLAQWQAFLEHDALLPDAFKRIHVDFDYA